MPIVRIEMLPGRSTQQKRELVEVLTREIARIAETSPASVRIVIADIPKENWGIGGKLMSDT